MVGTPGRTLDMINRKELKLEKIKTVVLDEADQMLNMGFEEQITDIFDKIYQDREKKLQVCLFSATIPQWVREVAEKVMRKSDFVLVDLVKDLSNKTPKEVRHLSMCCIHSERTNSIADLSNINDKILLVTCYGGKNKSTIVFVPTKKDCNNLMLTDKIKQGRS